MITPMLITFVYNVHQTVPLRIPSTTLHVWVCVAYKENHVMYTNMLIPWTILSAWDFKSEVQLTYPNWSRWLLVILHFWKVMICFSHDAPVAGLSGWTKSRPFSDPMGSALPVTTHSESWNLYLLSPTGTISMTTAYNASGSRHDMLTLTTGNILL